MKTFSVTKIYGLTAAFEIRKKNWFVLVEQLAHDSLTIHLLLYIEVMMFMFCIATDRTSISHSINWPVYHSAVSWIWRISEAPAAEEGK